MDIEVLAKDLQKGDVISIITGDVAIVESLEINHKDCWILFESGHKFYCFPDEKIKVYRK